MYKPWNNYITVFYSKALEKKNSQDPSALEVIMLGNIILITAGVTSFT